MIIVTHDRYFLDNITKWILELENGRGLPFEGNYSSWLAQKVELLRVMEKKENAAAEDARSASWTGSATRTRAASKRTRPASRPTTSWPAIRNIDSKSETIIQIAPGPRLGDKVLTVEQRLQGLSQRRRVAEPHGGLHASTCRAAASSA